MLENLHFAFRGIWSHKMRSFLTMLGVIIGIASIIAIVSTITGTNRQIILSAAGRQRLLHGQRCSVRRDGRIR